jgi:hypothetical protein
LEDVADDAKKVYKLPIIYGSLYQITTSEPGECIFIQYITIETDDGEVAVEGCYHVIGWGSGHDHCPKI